MVAALLIAAGTVSIGFAQYVQHFVDVDGRIASVALLAAMTALLVLLPNIGIDKATYVRAIRPNL